MSMLLRWPSHRSFRLTLLLLAPSLCYAHAVAQESRTENLRDMKRSYELILGETRDLVIKGLDASELALERDITYEIPLSDDTAVALASRRGGVRKVVMSVGFIRVIDMFCDGTVIERAFGKPGLTFGYMKFVLDERRKSVDGFVPS